MYALQNMQLLQLLFEVNVKAFTLALKMRVLQTDFPLLKVYFSFDSGTGVKRQRCSGSKIIFTLLSRTGGHY